MSHHSSRLPKLPIVLWLIHKFLLGPTVHCLCLLSLTSSPPRGSWRHPCWLPIVPQTCQTYSHLRSFAPAARSLWSAPRQLYGWLPLFFFFSISAQMSHPQKGLHLLCYPKWKPYHFLILPTVLVICWRNEGMKEWFHILTTALEGHYFTLFTNEQTLKRLNEDWTTTKLLSQGLKLLYWPGPNTSHLIRVLKGF